MAQSRFGMSSAYSILFSIFKLKISSVVPGILLVKKSIMPHINTFCQNVVYI